MNSRHYADSDHKGAKFIGKTRPVTHKL